MVYIQQFGNSRLCGHAHNIKHMSCNMADINYAARIISLQNKYLLMALVESLIASKMLKAIKPSYQKNMHLVVKYNKKCLSQQMKNTAVVTDFDSKRLLELNSGRNKLRKVLKYFNLFEISQF